MLDLIQPSLTSLRSWLEQHELPGYRAEQVRRWLYAGRASSFQEMTDLPGALREKLAEDFRFWTSRIVARRTTDDGTEKLLLEWGDQEQIECVLLREGQRRTICISTQVGCAMGCVFCASGIGGVVRNLSAGEIVEQMLLLDRLLGPDERISNIVVMGMGEPLANVNELLPALEVATAAAGLGIGARRITISTVGLPKAVHRLAAEGCRYHLAISLHAPNDALRTQIVPVNKNVGLQALLAAADEYFESSGRRLTFEYVLLADVNDQPRHAHQLAALLRRRTALINIIPYNPVAGLPYRSPSSTSVNRFVTTLQDAGLEVSVRHRKGDKIDAACGQLRRTVRETIQLQGELK